MMPEHLSALFNRLLHSETNWTRKNEAWALVEIVENMKVAIVDAESKYGYDDPVITHLRETFEKYMRQSLIL